MVATPARLASAGITSLGLTSQEQALYSRHVEAFSGKKYVTNTDGSISTLGLSSVEHDGAFYNIPTVWDGAKLSGAAAAAKVEEAGWGTFPSYLTMGEAAVRASVLQGYLGRDKPDALPKPVPDPAAPPPAPKPPPVQGQTASKPVRLDPWQLVRAVHWGDETKPDLVWTKVLFGAGGLAGVTSITAPFQTDFYRLTPVSIPAGSWVAVSVQWSAGYGSSGDITATDATLESYSDSAGNEWKIAAQISGKTGDYNRVWNGSSYDSVWVSVKEGVALLVSRLTNALEPAGSFSATFTALCQCGVAMWVGVNLADGDPIAEIKTASNFRPPKDASVITTVENELVFVLPLDASFTIIPAEGTGLKVDGVLWDLVKAAANADMAKVNTSAPRHVPVFNDATFGDETDTNTGIIVGVLRAKI